VNGCNFRCFYCYVPDLHSSIDPSVINEHSLSATTADLVAQRLVEFCLSNSYQKLHVKFAGGEPTLNLSAIRHFCTSILKMRQTLRITFGMISNGSFCSDDLIPILDEYDIGISLSVDGFEGSHDQVRFTILAKNKVGSWKLLEQNVERLLMAGRKPYFLFTLTRLNAPSLIQFATWAHSRKLGFRISPVRAQTAVSKNELDFIAQHVIDLYEYLGRCMPESLDFDRDARFAEWNLRKQKQSACGSCRNYIAITERGDMKPCQMSSSAPLSATSHSVSDALLQFRADPLVSLIAQPGLRRGACTRCQFFHTCTGGCPQHTLAVFQDVEHPSPWCQLFGRLLPHYLHAKASHMWRQVSALENGTVRDTELASPDMSHRAID
jgi:radical SAM protein with 4Fe4S-binding SPASM domain